jgi:hypothetical protein
LGDLKARLRLLKRSLDAHLPCVEVHVTPAQGQQLAAARTGREAYDGNRVDRAAAQRLQHGLDLIGRRDLAPLDRRGIGARYRIGRDRSPSHGVAEDAVHQAVDMADGARVAEPTVAGIALKLRILAWYMNVELA